MDLTKLVSHMGWRKHQNIVITFDNGQAVRRTHETLRADIRAAVSKLSSWGVRPGMRVGMWADNCYEWIVHELALVELRALSVAFTDDFSGMSGDQLIDRYLLSLLLVLSTDGRFKDSRHAGAIAFMEIVICVSDGPAGDGGEWASADSDRPEFAIMRMVSVSFEESPGVRSPCS